MSTNGTQVPSPDVAPSSQVTVPISVGTPSANTEVTLSAQSSSVVGAAGPTSVPGTSGVIA